MAQLHSLETKVPMKSPEKLAAVFRDNVHSLPQLVPGIIKTAEIIGGGRQMAPGSVFISQYSFPGSPLMSVKIKWEAVDEAEGKWLTLRVIEGEMLEMYKSYCVRVEIDRDAGQVGWLIEYEKANPNVPPPRQYAELIYTQLCKASDN
ncbi:unnamed protein product [Linum tenue]|uniref:Bet v I/Major latex protein domain-containing protein n=2 Tax=Linum tenue TaxID=586396 RepID=A0AAV0KAR6_9ROSI|nr:unnamed protein product [Linum tenue]